MALNRRRFDALQHRTLPLYVVNEFQSYPFPRTNRSRSVGERNLSLTFQAAVGLLVSPQIPPSQFLDDVLPNGDLLPSGEFMLDNLVGVWSVNGGLLALALHMISGEPIQN